jgi:cell division protein FtsI/penicillin-binding protein 2
MRKFGKSITFSSSHPAASIFKVVTTSALLTHTDVTPETNFKFRGRSTTLYRYQLQSPKNKRWVRNQNLRYAFATSNNVIFGRSAIENLNGKHLTAQAKVFGFNRDLMNEVSLGRSFMAPPISLYNLAEVASGFNRKTLMSPVHGAYIASLIAREGKDITPRLIKSLTEVDGGNVYNLLSKENSKQLVKPTVAKNVKEMMELVVRRGTARSAYRRFLRTRLASGYRFGGKTGTITGGLPYGRRDWFISFGQPEDDPEDLGVSMCVMIINKKKWYVRSSVLTKRIMYKYLKLKNKRERND